LFGTGAFHMRGAGCTVNNFWDRKHDAQVESTGDRPFASEQLKVQHAIGLVSSQLVQRRF